MDSLVDEVAVSLLETLSARAKNVLYERLGSAEAILSATAEELRRAEKSAAKSAVQAEISSDKIISLRERAEETIADCAQRGIEIITRRDARYPQLLAAIYDPPPILFWQGSFAESDAFALAVIGTRHPTPYGRRVTEMLTSALSRAGMTIVSGLARGIDSVAHRAALAAGSRTIAVLGSGHQQIYPKEHISLAEKIAASGAVVSEFPPSTPPAPWRFPQRNRIVSGLALGVLVTEAPRASGTMITARLASEQGRCVFAVPHAIDSPKAPGCHDLLRDGATLVETIDDILQELSPLEKQMQLRDHTFQHPAELLLNEQERFVLDAIAPGKTTTRAALAGKTSLTTTQIATILTVLESRQLIYFTNAENVTRIG